MVGKIMMKTFLRTISKFILKIIKDNEEQIKKAIWDLILFIVRTVRENRKAKKA
jgi:hypothetical protein